MKAGIILITLAWSAYGQTCGYTTGKIPQGTIAVFRNGALLRQGPDFTYGKRVITPITFSPGDKFSTLFSIQIPLTLPDNTPYTAYRNWVESWDCPGAPPQPASSLQLLESCAGSGPSPQDPKLPAWSSGVTYPASTSVNFGTLSYFSLQASNVGQQPDISPLWWKVVSYDCSGMMRATIKLSDGSTLVLTGVSGAASGSQIVWNPVK